MKRIYTPVLIAAVSVAGVLITGCGPGTQAAQSSIHHYPNGARVNFLTSCQKSVATTSAVSAEDPAAMKTRGRTYCVATLACLERDLPFTDFRAADAALVAGEAANVTTRTTVRGCMAEGSDAVS